MSNDDVLILNDTSTEASEFPPHGLPRAEHPNVKAQIHVDNASQRKSDTSLSEVCADINDRVNRLLSAPSKDETTRRTQEQTRVAISVIEKALKDYAFTSLSLSYNGGKDCQVLLILYLAVLHTHFTQPSGRRKPEPFPASIPSIYAKPPDPFDSVTSFVESSTRDYHLDLTHISTNPGTAPRANSHSSPPLTSHGDLAAAAAACETAGSSNNANGDVPSPGFIPLTNKTEYGNEDAGSNPKITFRDAFALYLQRNPNVGAIFVGTRRTDPHGATLKHFQMTDGNWPRFMRIHPVIDWRLSEIWCFLRSEHLADPKTGQKLEYCTMYDAGYTSLGGVGDTLKNPRLRYVDGEGNEGYKPAYEMTEDEDERAGRE